MVYRRDGKYDSTLVIADDRQSALEAFYAKHPSRMQIQVTEHEDVIDARKQP